MFLEFSFNLKLLFILVFPIFKELDKLFLRDYLEKDNKLFKTFRIFLSLEFSFIFLLILKCMNKSNKRAMSQDENEKNDEHTSHKLVDIEIKSVKKKKQN